MAAQLCLFFLLPLFVCPFFPSLSKTREGETEIAATEEEEKPLKTNRESGGGGGRVAVLLRVRVRYKQSDGKPVR